VGWFPTEGVNGVYGVISGGIGDIGEAESMGGRIVEMDIHEWRSAEGEVGCLEIAAKLGATHTKCKCSAAWWHWDGETREARQGK
jgi:hypothetical protein